MIIEERFKELVKEVCNELDVVIVAMECDKGQQGVKLVTQTITIKVTLLPTKEQIRLLEQSSHEYIQLIHTLVSEMVEEKKSTKKVQRILKSTFQVQ